MRRENPKSERREELALAGQAAALGAIAAMVSDVFGPAGAVAAALVGPFAEHAWTRLRELSTHVEEAGFDEDAIKERLADNESIAQVVASAVRGVVESDLRSKRLLLARAVVRALQDDAAADIEARFVRTAGEIDTVDVRVLAIIGGPQEATQSGKEVLVYLDQVTKDWPANEAVLAAAMASLSSAGLAEHPNPGAIRGTDMVRVSLYGREFLSRLQQEGLEDEIRARAAAEESTAAGESQDKNESD